MNKIFCRYFIFAIILFFFNACNNVVSELPLVENDEKTNLTIDFDYLYIQRAMQKDDIINSSNFAQVFIYNDYVMYHPHSFWKEDTKISIELPPNDYKILVLVGYMGDDSRVSLLATSQEESIKLTLDQDNIFQPVLHTITYEYDVPSTIEVCHKKKFALGLSYNNPKVRLSPEIQKVDVETWIPPISLPFKQLQRTESSKYDEYFEAKFCFKPLCYYRSIETRCCEGYHARSVIYGFNTYYELMNIQDNQNLKLIKDNVGFDWILANIRNLLTGDWGSSSLWECAKPFVVLYDD